MSGHSQVGTLLIAFGVGTMAIAVIGPSVRNLILRRRALTVLVGRHAPTFDDGGGDAGTTWACNACCWAGISPSLRAAQTDHRRHARLVEAGYFPRGETMPQTGRTSR